MYQGWTVLCDSHQFVKRAYECCASDQISGTKSKAAAEFKKSRWKRVRYGKTVFWLCPQCADDIL